MEISARASCIDGKLISTLTFEKEGKPTEMLSLISMIEYDLQVLKTKVFKSANDEIEKEIHSDFTLQLETVAQRIKQIKKLGYVEKEGSYIHCMCPAEEIPSNLLKAYSNRQWKMLIKRLSHHINKLRERQLKRTKQLKKLGYMKLCENSYCHETLLRMHAKNCIIYLSDVWVIENEDWKRLCEVIKDKLTELNKGNGK